MKKNVTFNHCDKYSICSSQLFVAVTKRCYLQVCHHYLLPILSQLPHDASLLKSQAAAGSSSSPAAANPPPATTTSSFNNSSNSLAAGQSMGSPQQQLTGEDGGENKENLPEPITEVQHSSYSSLLFCMFCSILYLF